MIGLMKKFELVVVHALMLVMVAIVLFTLMDFIWMLYKDVVTPPLFLLSITQLLDLFGFVMLILIGLELLETIHAYIREHVVHVEIVLEVALIAISRKVIILDFKKSDGLSLLGIAAIIVSLAVACYMVKKRFVSKSEGRDAPAGGTGAGGDISNS